MSQSQECPAIGLRWNLNPEFTGLITSSVMLRDGTKTQILTFVPAAIHFEEIVMGLNTALDAAGDVLLCQHHVASLHGKKIKPFTQFHPRACRHDRCKK